MQRYSAILGNLKNTCARFCGSYKENPSSIEMLKLNYYTKSFRRISVVVLSIMALPIWASDVFSLWDMKELSKVPKSESAEPYIAASKKIRWTEGSNPSQRPQGVQAVWLHGPTYRGKATKIFAWMGVPKAANKQAKVPGMVLVHGGGGTAFAQWVAMWNRRGYAAIAIDTSGRAPAQEAYNGHPYAGPRYCGDFAGALKAPRDQWTYHAVAAVILAHSYLRSLKGVDPKRTGLTGISWGGYLTCISAAIDTRFKLAIPVYGCGFLGENSSWVDRLNAVGPEKRKEWLRLWDPSHYIGKIKMPVLWVAFTNDTAYPMDSLQKSYRLLQSKLSLCVLTRFGHSHRCGWSRPEIAAFADSFFVQQKILPCR